MKMDEDRIMNITEETPPPFGPPTALDIVLPPTIFIAFIILSILILSILTQPRWWRNRCSLAPSVETITEETIVVTQVYPQTKHGWCDIPESKDLTKTSDLKNPLSESLPNGNDRLAKEDRFFTTEDIDVLTKMEEFQNNPMSLICICVPVLASLAFCPVTIITYGMWMDFFWPPEITGPMTNINDAIACFLMPAGLVYAIAFGFALQDVLAKKTNIEKSLQDQFGLLQQTHQLLKCGEEIFKDSTKQIVAYAMKEAVISWMAKLLGVKRSDNKGTLWDAINTLQKVQNQTPINNDNKKGLDDHIVKTMYSNLLQLDNALSNDSHKGDRSINCLQWLFLELLGFISFFGILMVKAGSYRLELTMCILTVFSISVFSYILADLDNSYHGAFRTSLKPHVDFVKSLNMHSKPERYQVFKH